MNMAHAQHCSGCGVELGLIVESALQGKKNAKEALDSTVARGNDLLRQFQRANM